VPCSLKTSAAIGTVEFTGLLIMFTSACITVDPNFPLLESDSPGHNGIFMAKVIDDRIYISFRLKAQKIILAGA